MNGDVCIVLRIRDFVVVDALYKSTFTYLLTAMCLLLLFAGLRRCVHLFIVTWFDCHKITDENFALRKEAGPPPATLASSTQRTMVENDRCRVSHLVYHN